MDIYYRLISGKKQYMRFKKQKRHRKIVRFFTACFGFREPFKVLCDGTFVHHLLVNRIIPADSALANFLGAAVKIFTTRCAIAELKSLGNSYNESLNTACNLITARCDHERWKSAVTCITEVIGENNPEHFFVATQDADLRKKLQEIPGVPVIFGLRNALFLEPPSAIQYQHAKSAEEERSRMSELEYKMLNVRKKRRLATEEAGDFSDTSEGVGDQNLSILPVREAKTPRMRTDVKDKAQFKRKKAKGPNPLSCKKKKNHGNPYLVSDKESRDDGKTGRSRSRKRKRSRKGKNLAEATG